MANHPPATTEAHAPAVADTLASTEAPGGGEHHAEPTALGFDASGWVALAMVAVFALMIWKKVPSAIGKALDKKIATIRQQLDEAAELRAEAESLKAEYEAKSAQAGAEAATMVERARAEAAGIVAQAETDAAALIERRTRMAEEKIARAEAQALSDVRASAVESAIAAAEKILKSRTTGATADALVDSSIRDLGGKLN